MRILLCCAGGFSTNMLMQNMAKVVKDSRKLNEADFILMLFRLMDWKKKSTTMTLFWSVLRLGIRLAILGKSVIRATFRMPSSIKMFTGKWMAPR